MDDNENETSQDVDCRCGRKMGRRVANRKRDQEQATDREWIETERGWIEDGKVLVWQVVDGGVGYRGRRCTPSVPHSPAVLQILMLTSLRHSSHRPRGASPLRPPRRRILLVAHCSPPCTKTRREEGTWTCVCVCVCVYGCMEADGQRCER
jgi:hypothetical protein